MLIIFWSLDFQLGYPNRRKNFRGQKYASNYRLNIKIGSTMPCLSGFELYSPWAPLILRRGRLRVRDFLVLAPAFEPASFWREKRDSRRSSENSRSQIAFRTDVFQKLTLGAPVECKGLYGLSLRSEWLFTLRRRVAETYPICDAPKSRSARSSIASLKKSHWNHCFMCDFIRWLWKSIQK